MKPQSSYPNITTRLFVGFGILLSLFITVIYFSTTDLKKMSELNKKMIKHPYTVSNSVKDISLYIYSIHHLMLEVLQTLDKNELNQIKDSIDLYENLIYKDFEIVFERFLGEKEDVQRAYNLYEGWKPIRDEIISLLEQGGKEEALKVSRGRESRQMKELSEAMRFMIDFANAKALEFGNKSKDLMKKTSNELTLILIITICMAGFTLTWIFFSINVQLTRVTKRIESVSEAEYADRIKFRKGNKLAILGIAVDELENYKTRLKTLVEERARALKSEQLFTNKALNAQTDTFLVFNPKNGENIRWNQAFLNVSGYGDDEMNKLKTFADFYDAKDIKKGESAVKKSMEIGFDIVRMDLITKTGDRVPFEYSISTLDDSRAGDTFLVLIGRDISDRIKQEKEIEKYRENLEELVEERTEELKHVNEKLLKSNKELEHFNQLFVNREFRINEMKEKVKMLEQKIDHLKKK